MATMPVSAYNLWEAADNDCINITAVQLEAENSN